MSLIVDSKQHFWTDGTYQTSWMEAPLMPMIPRSNRCGVHSGRMI
jgi:hypothetical protein